MVVDGRRKKEVRRKYGMNYYRVDNEDATRARKYQNTLQNITVLFFYQYVTGI